MVNLRSKTNSSAATPWHRIYFCAAYPSIPLQPKPSPIIVTSHDPTSRSSTRSCLQEKYHAQHQQQYPARAAIIFSYFNRASKALSACSQCHNLLVLVSKHSHDQEGFTDTQPTMPPGNSWQRNVRSKFWWFSRSCNSHYVSHFAAFFIIVETKTSIAESCKTFLPCRTLPLGVTPTKMKTWYK